ncbi:MAG: CopG family transcriptional regulator [Phycisphaerae bacterium]
MPQSKNGIITFKADASLLEAMAGIENRSEFIRRAVLAALENACPMCKGTGIMTPNQRRHWDAFARDHAVEQCGDCEEFRLVCAKSAEPSGLHRRGRRA